MVIWNLNEKFKILFCNKRKGEFFFLFLLLLFSFQVHCQIYVSGNAKIIITDNSFINESEEESNYNEFETPEKSPVVFINHESTIKGIELIFIEGSNLIQVSENHKKISEEVIKHQKVTKKKFKETLNSFREKEKYSSIETEKFRININSLPYSNKFTEKFQPWTNMVIPSSFNSEVITVYDTIIKIEYNNKFLSSSHNSIIYRKEFLLYCYSLRGPPALNC